MLCALIDETITDTASWDLLLSVGLERRRWRRERREPKPPKRRRSREKMPPRNRRRKPRGSPPLLLRTTTATSPRSRPPLSSTICTPLWTLIPCFSAPAPPISGCGFCGKLMIRYWGMLFPWIHLLYEVWSLKTFMVSSNCVCCVGEMITMISLYFLIVFSLGDRKAHCRDLVTVLVSFGRAGMMRPRF